MALNRLRIHRFCIFSIFTTVVFAQVKEIDTTDSSSNRHLLQNNLVGLYSGAYQDTATQLQTAILDADLDLAISLLTASKDANALGTGLRFPPEKREEYTRITPQRVEDPDVITIKAVAGASLRLGDCNWMSTSTSSYSNVHPQVNGILKLADVIMIATTPRNGVYPPGVNPFEIHLNVIRLLTDRQLMQQILDDNPLQSTLNRKLMIATGRPVNSWVCFHCYPTKFCRESSWWCS